MLTEILGGALLGSALKPGVKPIKNSKKKYLVVSVNKRNGVEEIHVVFITSDLQEASVWAKTAVSFMGSVINSQIRVDKTTEFNEAYFVEKNGVRFYYAVVEYDFNPNGTWEEYSLPAVD